tara:strand:+ start:9156 stop:10238 length:1083 start_codon:yes stop_codon:yes gene_type:complete
MVTQPFVDPAAAGPKGEQVTVYGPQGEVRNAQRFARVGESKSELRRFTEDLGYSLTKPSSSNMSQQGITSGGQSELTQTAKNTVLREAEVKFGAVLPQALTDIYLDAYVNNSNDATEAGLVMRQSSEYQAIFPGNLNPDGATVKFTESEYIQQVTAYKKKIDSIGINSDLVITAERQKELIENAVSPDEFGSRVNTVYSNIIDAVPQVREFYNRQFNRELTDVEIIASALDPQINDQVTAGTILPTELLSQKVVQAQIGGEALIAGIDISLDEAAQLRQRGVTVQSARAGFSQAEAIQAAAAAQGRQEIGAADIVLGTQVGEPGQLQQVQNILAQVRAESAAVLGAAQARTGEVTGLVEA